MKINLELVATVFNDVLNGRITREAADRWSYLLIKQSESEFETLIFEPAADRERIWDDVMYLYGIDSMEAPGKYLHTNEDIHAAMERKLEIH